MININHYGYYSVLLLQDWVFTKKPSVKEMPYALKVGESPTTIIGVVESRDLAKEAKYRTKADSKKYVVPTNVRLEGTYETMQEAEFIKSKLIKAMRNLDKSSTANKKPDWLVSINQEKRLLCSSVYTNGESCVVNYLEWLSNLKEDKFESFLHHTKSSKDKLEVEFETFADFIRYRENLYKPKTVREYEPTKS
jgi:hypothetical protein